MQETFWWLKKKSLIGLLGQEFAVVVCRRSGQYSASDSSAPSATPLGFNPNESAPPTTRPRPHSIYRMESPAAHR